MYKHLTQEQRYYIYVERQKGSTQKSIAEAIGVNESTVCRELRRNGGKNGSYNFLKAQQKSDARRHRTPGNSEGVRYPESPCSGENQGR